MCVYACMHECQVRMYIHTLFQNLLAFLGKVCISEIKRLAQERDDIEK